MRFKPNKNCNARAMTILIALAEAIDKFSLASGKGENVITSSWRPTRSGHRSFHPLGQAIDVRCNNKPDWWIDGVVYLIKAFKCYDFHVQYQIHGVGANLHIHIEYDTGDAI